VEVSRTSFIEANAWSAGQFNALGKGTVIPQQLPLLLPLLLLHSMGCSLV
jgi:hypothetical protein